VRYLHLRETAEAEVGAGFWASVWSTWLGRRADELERAFQRVFSVLVSLVGQDEENELPSSLPLPIAGAAGCLGVAVRRGTLNLPSLAPSSLLSFPSDGRAPLISVYDVNY